MLPLKLILLLFFFSFSVLYSQDLNNKSDSELYSNISKYISTNRILDALPSIIELVNRLETENRDPKLKKNLDRFYFLGGSGLIKRYIDNGKQIDLNLAQKYFEKHLEAFPKSKKAHLSLKNLGNILRSQQKWDASSQYFIRLYQDPELKNRLIPREQSLIMDMIIENFYVSRNWEKGKPWFQRGLNSTNLESQSKAAVALMESELVANENPNIEEVQRLIPYISMKSFIRHSVGFNYLLMKSARKLASNKKVSEASVLYELVLTTEDIIAFYRNFNEAKERQLTQFNKRSYQGVFGNAELKQKIQFKIAEVKLQLERLEDPQNKGYIASYTEDLEWLKGQNYALSARNHESFWAFNKLINQYPDYKRIEDVYYSAFSQALVISLDDFIESIGETYLSKNSFVKYRRVLSTQMAQYYLSHQNWDKFYKIAPSIILENSEDDYAVQMLVMLGESFLQNADIIGMRNQFKNLWDKNKKTRITPDCIYWYALSYLFNGEFGNAIILFKKVIDNFSESNYYPDSQFRLATCYYSQDEFKTANKLLTKFVKDYPNSPLIPEAETFLGDIDAYWANVEESLVHYHNVEKSVNLQENPNQIDFVAHATTQGATLLEENQRIDESIKLFEDFLTKYPNSEPVPQMIYKLGLAYEKIGRPDQMLNAWAESMIQHGNDPKATGIDQIADTFANKYHETSQIIESNSQLLLKLSKDKKMRQRIIADGGYRYKIFNQPYIDQSLKDQVTRDRNFRDQFVEKQSALKPYLAKYQAIQEGFKLESPEIIFKKALVEALEQNKRTLALRLQMMLDSIGKLQDFDAFLFSQEDLPFASPASLVWMGGKLQAVGQSSEAEKVFQYLLENFKESPFVPKALLSLGDIEIANQNYEKAILHFSKIESEFFDHESAPIALISKIEILLEQKDHTLARQILKKIVKNRQWRGETHAKAFYYLGETHFQEQNYQDALSFFERAYFGFKKYPRFAIVSCKRASETLINLGNPQKAKEYIKELLEDKRFSNYLETSNDHISAKNYHQIKSIFTNLK